MKRISLVFEEAENTRTQEFVLRWSSDLGRSFREIVRQQWNLSPPGTVQELEDYLVDLTGLTVMELEIIPDKSGGEARSSLESCVWPNRAEIADVNNKQTWSVRWEQWP